MTKYRVQVKYEIEIESDHPYEFNGDYELQQKALDIKPFSDLPRKDVNIAKVREI